MRQSVLWRKRSRVDFVRVELVCKVLRQEHILGKGQTQRAFTVWGSQVFIKKSSGLCSQFYLRKTHDWVASRAFRMMPSGTKIQAFDIGTLGQVQPPHPCAVYNFWVMRQTCTACRSLVIAR
jgi:hypothetical protein